jgi:hypothetical protein
MHKHEQLEIDFITEVTNKMINVFLCAYDNPKYQKMLLEHTSCITKSVVSSIGGTLLHNFCKVNTNNDHEYAELFQKMLNNVAQNIAYGALEELNKNKREVH